MQKLWIFGILCAFLLAGCDLGGDTSATSVAAVGSPTGTSTDAPTDVPTDIPATGVATATPTFSVPKPTACGKDFPGGVYGYIGDMLISQPSFAFLSYPGIRLPDNMPAGQPYAAAQRTASLGNGTFGSNPPVYVAHGNPPSLPDGGAGFVVTLCNSSTTTTHTLRALGAEITGFTSAGSGTLDAEVGCDTSVSASSPPIAGCGGSLGPADIFHANWPSGAGVGASVTLSQTGSSGQAAGGGGFTQLPITLKPGKVYTAFIGMNYPGRPGNYTFQFGMQVDGVPLATVGANTAQVLMATSVTQWSGSTCYSNSAWLAVVKAHPNSWYVCPA